MHRHRNIGEPLVSCFIQRSSAYRYLDTIRGAAISILVTVRKACGYPQQQKEPRQDCHVKSESVNKYKLVYLMCLGEFLSRKLTRDCGASNKSINLLILPGDPFPFESLLF